jgi:oxepin-CoA hydrolase/3-oxo-5,6-dehydrosuberyl-CoA semialdehyde dehydrogenase
VLEKYHDSLYNHRALPRLHKAPKVLQEQVETLRFENLEIAKQQLLGSYERYEQYFKENPGETTKNAVFGILNKFEWDLSHTKHFNHHFEQFGLLPKL